MKAAAGSLAIFSLFPGFEHQVSCPCFQSRNQTPLSEKEIPVITKILWNSFPVENYSIYTKQIVCRAEKFWEIRHWSHSNDRVPSLWIRHSGFNKTECGLKIKWEPPYSTDIANQADWVFNVKQTVKKKTKTKNWWTEAKKKKKCSQSKEKKKKKQPVPAN